MAFFSEKESHDPSIIFVNGDVFELNNTYWHNGFCDQNSDW